MSGIVNEYPPTNSFVRVDSGKTLAMGDYTTGSSVTVFRNVNVPASRVTILFRALTLLALGLAIVALFTGCAATVVSVAELKLNHAGWQTQRQFVDSIPDPTLKASAIRHVDAMTAHAGKMVEEASK